MQRFMSKPELWFFKLDLKKKLKSSQIVTSFFSKIPVMF